MRIEEIKVCILRIEGTNCEQETFDSFRRLGANPEFVHLKQLTSKDVHENEKRKLSDYQIVMIPGGFSSGDYIRAGAIFAARMKSKLSYQLKEFVENGYSIGGICNGFQVLVESGLLPAFGKTMSRLPEAVLATNESDRFECRPAYLKHESKSNCVFTSKIPKGKIIVAPCAHAEGKFLFPSGKEEEGLKQLIENDQIVFRYVDDAGEYADYPWNPNGSLYNIAGICNENGNVFGMMPHPERVFYRYAHPDWMRGDKKDWEGDGKAVFESVLDYTSRKF
ncbi:MAG: phosphoribosylformylglycinamidine synthase subunit PurQ [Thermoplasmata archaeon]|nr:MAG: phosphoribosylformylglycinamidine synthase subunit PurQ [Thermoplasmata archaeon]